MGADMTNAGKFLSIALLALFTVMLSAPNIPAQDGSTWAIPADTTENTNARPGESPTGDEDDNKLFLRVASGEQHIEPHLGHRTGIERAVSRAAYLIPLKTGPPAA